jgi:hypothetical protein
VSRKFSSYLHQTRDLYRALALPLSFSFSRVRGALINPKISHTRKRRDKYRTRFSLTRDRYRAPEAFGGVSLLTRHPVNGIG